jgi:transposase
MARDESKRQRLKQDGALHPQPQKVSTELLARSDFFDANDLVQMKYEMLRRANVEPTSVSAAARAFGLSRVAFYRAQQQYQELGLVGLLPHKRGPKQAHKLTAEVLDFVRQQLPDDATPDWQQLRRRIEERFGTRVHARSIERAVKQQKKGSTP